MCERALVVDPIAHGTGVLLGDLCVAEHEPYVVLYGAELGP